VIQGAIEGGTVRWGETYDYAGRFWIGGHVGKPFQICSRHNHRWHQAYGPAFLKRKLVDLV
jgi:hypothetical protein